MNGVKRALARKVAWAIAMSTAAYGAEAIWEDQGWMLDGFDRLTALIGRAVAAAFSTTKGEEKTPLELLTRRLLARLWIAEENAYF